MKILMEEIDGLEVALLGGLVVLLLKSILCLDMQTDIVAPLAVLVLGVVGYLIGYLVGLRIVLVGGLVGGLVTPRDVEQALVALALALGLQLLGNLDEAVSLRCADKLQHFRLKLHLIKTVLCYHRQAKQAGNR